MQLYFQIWNVHFYSIFIPRGISLNCLSKSRGILSNLISGSLTPWVRFSIWHLKGFQLLEKKSCGIENETVCLFVARKETLFFFYFFFTYVIYDTRTAIISDFLSLNLSSLSPPPSLFLSRLLLPIIGFRGRENASLAAELGPPGLPSRGARSPSLSSRSARPPSLVNLI